MNSVVTAVKQCMKQRAPRLFGMLKVCKGGINRILKGCIRRVAKIKERLFFKEQLPFLVVITGTACSLKCRDCANFIPYAPLDTRHYPLGDLKANIAKVLSAVDEITSLQVQGGEPFLYKELDALLDYLIAQKKIKSIVIATNGTIIPSWSILPYLQNKKVEVRISDYGNIVKDNLPQLVQFLKDKHVSHRVYEFAYSNSKWMNAR